MKKGDRVGALYGSDKGKKIVKFLGYGVYQGEEVPLEAVGGFADAAIEHKIKNPKVLLDSGKVVYGCECWWGSESQMKEEIQKYIERDYEVVTLCIDKIREEFRNNESN